MMGILQFIWISIFKSAREDTVGLSSHSLDVFRKL